MAGFGKNETHNQDVPTCPSCGAPEWESCGKLIGNNCVRTLNGYVAERRLQRGANP